MRLLFLFLLCAASRAAAQVPKIPALSQALRTVIDADAQGYADLRGTALKDGFTSTFTIPGTTGNRVAVSHDGARVAYHAQIAVDSGAGGIRASLAAWETAFRQALPGFILLPTADPAGGREGFTLRSPDSNPLLITLYQCTQGRTGGLLLVISTPHRMPRPLAAPGAEAVRP